MEESYCEFHKVEIGIEWREMLSNGVGIIVGNVIGSDSVARFA